MRLTEKNENGEFLTKQPFTEMINKLGQLEDILEKYDMDNMLKLDFHLGLLRELAEIRYELGIDLSTLFKALKEGIYVKNPFGQIYKISVFIYDLNMSSSNSKLNWCFISSNYNNSLIYFSDYGKTWALTKEELK